MDYSWVKTKTNAVNITGLDPSSSFVKALEEMRFMKICAVLLCWREVPVEVVSMICDLFSAILGWDVGIVYLCNEGESTWAALRALLAWEEEGSGTTAIYAAHCVEVNLFWNCFGTFSLEETNAPIPISLDHAVLRLSGRGQQSWLPGGRRGCTKSSVTLWFHDDGSWKESLG